MIKAADIRGTRAYAQLREWNDAVNGGNPWTLGQLVKQFLANLNEHKDPDFNVWLEMDVDAAFFWEDTPEGHYFWNAIGNGLFWGAGAVQAAGHAAAHQPFLLDEPNIAAQPKKKEEAPKKVLGWWQP